MQNGESYCLPDGTASRQSFRQGGSVWPCNWFSQTVIYNIRFAPQNTILILDYPVLKNISQYTGIDKIYAYIRCICLEQEFLGLFPVEYVTGVLSKYKDETDNLCEIVLVDVIRHILLKRPFNVSDWTKEDHIQIQAVLMGTVGHGERSALEEILASFVRKYCGGNVALLKYLLEDIRNIETRMI